MKLVIGLKGDTSFKFPLIDQAEGKRLDDKSRDGKDLIMLLLRALVQSTLTKLAECTRGICQGPRPPDGDRS